MHCSEGKERAGITSAVIEALMGASANEIMDDYLTTYIDFYDAADSVQIEQGKDMKNEYYTLSDPT